MRVDKIKIDTTSENFVAYQYFGRAKDMPKRMKQHFKDKGIEFTDDEMIEVVEYIEYEIVKRW